MPNNLVEHFGNTSGATIPMVMAYNLRERLLQGQFQVCLAGFGGGLTWSAMLLKLGRLAFNKIIDYKQ